MKAKFGRYIFLKKLAVGGMAEVYLARRVSFGGFAKFVVIKRLLPEHKGRNGFERLFLAEARTGAILNHPNIVGLHDLGKLDDHYFMAMEFVDGMTVADLMTIAARDKKPVPLGVALRIGIGVADALYYAHHALDEHGQPLRILHHDITPQNIQVTYDGDVKLLDFGVATRMGRPTSGGRRGKPAYMSPEAISKAPLDARSDLFSLGVVLYELTTGRRTPKSAEAATSFENFEVPDRPEPTKLDPYFPKTVEEALMSLLAASPDTRPADARVVSKALTEAGRKLGFDLSAQALAAYVAELMGESLIKHREELADLARKSDPVPKPVAPPPSVEVGPDGPPQTLQTSGEPGATLGENGAATRPPPGLEAHEPNVSGEYDAQDLPFSDAALAVDDAPDLLMLSAPSLATAPPAASPVTPPVKAARTGWVAVLAVVAALAGGRFWGERAASESSEVGTLEIETTPPGARVYDGDRLLGMTPFSDPRAPVGRSYDLRIALPGFSEWHGALTLEPARRHRSLSIDLKSAP